MPEDVRPVPYLFTECMAIVRNHQLTYPVMAVPIANALGLEVFRVSDWPTDEVSGQILKDNQNGGPSGFAIFVNGNHPVERRRFTIAHEIAHFILHRDEIGDGIEESGLYQSRLETKEEQEANRLAIHEILVPNTLLSKAIAEARADKSLTIPTLATLFQVTNSLMSIKLGIPYETFDEHLPQEA